MISASTPHWQVWSRVRATAGILTLAVLSLAVGQMAASGSRVRPVVAAVTMLASAALAFTNRRHALYVLVVWMTALGFLRRFMTELWPTQGQDVLLLVGPAAIVALFAVARSRQPRHATLLSRAVGVMAVLALLEAVNPLQGSVKAGLAGLLFVLVPILAFWIGRALDDAAIARVLKLVGVLAVGAAIYGLVQTYAGFPSWDARWLRTDAASFNALHVNGVTRPFSAFSSFAEYGCFIALGFVVWVAFARGFFGRLAALAALGLLGTALVLSSTRTVVLTTVVALAVRWAARRRLAPVAAIVTVTVLVALVPVLASQVPGLQVQSARGKLTTHLVVGLANPLNTKDSTLRRHLDLLRAGLTTAVTNPVGSGLGAISLAGIRFGTQTANTELDPSNAATGLGLPGLVTFLIVFVAGFGAAYRVARARRDALALAALGILCVTVFQWLNGGQYAVAYVVWLVLGWFDRQTIELYGLAHERR